MRPLSISTLAPGDTMRWLACTALRSDAGTGCRVRLDTMLGKPWRFEEAGVELRLGGLVTAGCRMRLDNNVGGALAIGLCLLLLMEARLGLGNRQPTLARFRESPKSQKPLR